MRMVTRSINVATYTAICMDMTDMSNILTGEQTFTLTGDVLETSKALKSLQAKYQTDTFKIVAITDCNVVEKLYGIPEIEFLEMARELDPETRKPL